MLRNALGKAMWVGRTTAAVIGLAVALAVVFGVTTMALAAVPGDPFKLGKLNTINAMTRLVGTNANTLLKVTNNGTGSALGLEVKQGVPPMRVNSDKRVPNLNADRLDGLDSAGLMPSKTYTVEQSRDLPANAFGGASVSCDQGDIAISGGYSGRKSFSPISGTVGYAHLSRNTQINRFHRPTGEGQEHRWEVGFSTGATTDVLVVHTVCADLPPLRP